MIFDLMPLGCVTPAMQVEWVKLHELFEYLLHCLHPFQLAPGQSKSFYVDLTYTVMLAVKVPDLSLKTDR